MTPAVAPPASAMVAISGRLDLLGTRRFAGVTVRQHPGPYVSSGPQVPREILCSLASAAL